VSTLHPVWTHSSVPTLPILFDYSHSVQGVTTGRLPFCTIGVLGSALLSRESEQRQAKLWERTWIWDRYAHAYAFVSPAREHLSDT